MGTEVIQPLSIDERILRVETSRYSHRILSAMKRIFPCLAYPGPLVARKSVIKQLQLRTMSSLDAWEGSAREPAIELLPVIEKELSLPNRYLIPEDPAGIVFEAGYPGDLDYLAIEVGDVLGIKCEREELDRMATRGWTMREVFAELQRRASDAAEGEGVE
jgi:hypothetical protein